MGHAEIILEQSRAYNLPNLDPRISPNPSGLLPGINTSVVVGPCTLVTAWMEGPAAYLDRSPRDKICLYVQSTDSYLLTN